MMTSQLPRVRLLALLSVSVALVLLGGALGALVQTGFGTVAVRDIVFAGDQGQLISAKLYVPNDATPETPAPGVLAIHGANNSSEMQDAYAIELSRRGYVVLTPDQYGHGGSDGDQTSGPIGPASLRYLHGLAMVDGDNVGIGGHSRGGAESYIAAALEPELYRAIVFEASGPTPQALPDPGAAPELHNALFIMTTFEEFAEPVWGEAVPAEVPNGAFAKSVMGTDSVVPGKVYGDFADGTARSMVLSPGNHPFMTFSFDAVQQTIDWYGKALRGGRSVDGQIWIWKEIGGGIALLGGLLAVFAVGGLLWSAPALASARRPLTAARGARLGLPWVAAAAVTGVVPVITYWPFQELGNSVLVGLPWWPQLWANGVMMWAVLNGAISAVLLGAWYLRGRKAGRLSVDDLSLGAPGFRWSLVFASAGVAFAAVGSAYLLLVLSDWLFKTDFRIYTMALAVIDARHWPLILAYLLPFAAFLLVLNTGLASQLRWTGGKATTAGRMIAYSLMLGVPLLVFFLVDYAPILFGGSMLVNEPLKSQLVLIGYQFLLILPLAACLAVFFHRVSGSVYTGAFTGALLVVWNLVTTTTVHFPDGGEWGTGAYVARIGLPTLVAAALLAYAVILRNRARATRDSALSPVDSGDVNGPAEHERAAHEPVDR